MLRGAVRDLIEAGFNEAAEAAIHKLEEHMARKNVKPPAKRSAGSGDYDAEN